MNRILIIDDERAICESLRFALRSKYTVTYELDGNRGYERAINEDVNLVLLDIRIGEVNGLDVLKKIKARSPHIAVIVMTAYGSESVALEAVRCGAYTYLSKPLNPEELRTFVEQALVAQKLNEDVQFLSEELASNNQKYEMVGRSEVMEQVFKLIEQLKDVNTAVCISGESGTGKELVARAIHTEGNRKNERFVAVNCAAIPESLLEEEFFGHKKGAFTGASADRKGKFGLAHKGTLFLDEIGDMPLALQGKLLRVIQSKEYTPIGGNMPQDADVRIITATNKNLAEQVREGKFREDLYYRLNVIEIRMPPLRERREDIPLLCDFFLRQYAKEQKKPLCKLTERAKDSLQRYAFPGNVRELANILERATILASGGEIDVANLPDALVNNGNEKNSSADQSGEDVFDGRTLREIECLAIEAALRKSGGKKAQAAQMLGISERTLWYKIKEYGIH